MESTNLFSGKLSIKVAMSLFVAMLSATSVSAEDQVKANTTDSTQVTTIIKEIGVEGKKSTKVIKDTRGRVVNRGGKKSGTTSAAGDVTTFQDGDDLWLTVTGVKLPEKPVKKGIYIHNGVKVAIQ
jgi:hypothetical protein